MFVTLDDDSETVLNRNQIVRSFIDKVNPDNEHDPGRAVGIVTTEVYDGKNFIIYKTLETLAKAKEFQRKIAGVM